MTVERTESRLAATLDARGAAYGVLSRALLAAPDAEFVDLLRDPDLAASWPMPADPHTERGVQRLAASQVDAETLEALEYDYNQLFVGPRPSIPPPYESVYLTREHLIFDEPTRAVRAVYAELGLVAPKLNREPDDHLGLEFNFVSHLCLAAIDAIERGDRAALERMLDAQREFLAQHVQLWVPRCLELAAGAAGTLFYQGIAFLGLGVLAQPPIAIA